MPRTPKSWQQKMQAAPPHTVRLDKAFAGVPAGARLLISSLRELQAFLHTNTRAGEFWPIQQLRRELARAHAADAACPVSTSIFLRIVAEAAWDAMQAGASAADVAPFWRVIEPDSPLAKKLRCGPQWIAQQRAAESTPRRARTTPAAAAPPRAR
ncbi:MAG: hypothetical protein MUC68_02755 [Burkholderiaceae bacterium]|jgi:hypothetical protein|nr:hypothetical protein [Burkholderiaceae bacterium]